MVKCDLCWAPAAIALGFPHIEVFFFLCYSHSRSGDSVAGIDEPPDICISNPAILRNLTDYRLLALWPSQRLPEVALLGALEEDGDQ